MVSIVDHAGHQLCNAEREGNKPKTKADWENLAEHATQLAVLRNKSFRPLATVNSMMSRRCRYKGERPHSALGPGLPDSSTRRTTLTGHRLPAAHRVVGSARLGGLHHHYELEPIAA